MDANAVNNRKNDYTELGAAASPKLMYHIRKEAEGWQLRFVSGDGLAVLGCTREDFLQRLSDCRSYNADTESYVRVGDVFNMLAERPQERNYVGSLHSDTRTWEIRSSMFSQKSPEGYMEIYGQAADITERNAREREGAVYAQGLLEVSRSVFPEILYINLTQNRYRILQYYGATTIGTPQEGALEDMLVPRLAHVKEEDRDAFRDSFFPDAMRKAFADGEERIQLAYRRIGKEGVWHWVETVAMRVNSLHTEDLVCFAVSRNIDKQKKEEEMLRRALSATSERLDEWLFHNGKVRAYYPGLTYIGYEDGRPSPYTVGILAKTLGVEADALALCTSERIPEAERNAFAREKAAKGPEARLHMDYRVEDNARGYVHIRHDAIPFTNAEGERGYLHFLVDASYEHQLLERLRAESEAKLRQSETLFRIVAAHSKRSLCYYDIASRHLELREGDGGNGAESVLLPLLLQAVRAAVYGETPKETADTAVLAPLMRMFSAIHRGSASGETHVHVPLPDGRKRWYQMQYSCLFENEKPYSALLSFEDVTERHEQAMSYLRFSQSKEALQGVQLSYMEADLTADLVEVHSGLELWNSPSCVGMAYTHFTVSYSMGLSPSDSARANALYSREGLLEKFRHGIRNENVWEVEREGKKKWILARMELAEDPFNGHIKLFVNMIDVSAEQEEKLEIAFRAEHDAMTGLLRADAGENRIRSFLLREHSPGILILLDLDDLKGINDSLGHDAGDVAIKGMAETIKGHFRRDDILVRRGGDEFMAYLPGAGASENSVALSVEALLRKLSRIAVGEAEGAARHIQCSIGCAVEMDGDSYESLSRRADIALYHIKRSGKNSYAFFEESMLLEDARFRQERFASSHGEDLSGEEARELNRALAAHVQGIVLFNLTGNFYRTIGMDEKREPISGSGAIGDFVREAFRHAHPEDRDTLLSMLERDRLLQDYAEGKTELRFTLRLREAYAEGYYRANAAIHFFRRGDGDVCAFILLKRSSAQENLELTRIEKLREFASVSGYEYVCIIHVRDRRYSVYSSDGQNTHDVPDHADFDKVTLHIRDSLIPAGAREAYYEAACLDNVLEQMRLGNAPYSYRYTMTDGAMREAVFTWYEESHSELLMSVRKLG